MVSVVDDSVLVLIMKQPSIRVNHSELRCSDKMFECWRSSGVHRVSDTEEETKTHRPHTLTSHMIRGLSGSDKQQRGPAKMERIRQ